MIYPSVGRPATTVINTDCYPDPERFRPERFLERRFSAFEYLPFGAGARRCIGMTFAQFEMKLVIKRISSGFELGLIDAQRVRPVSARAHLRALSVSNGG